MEKRIIMLKHYTMSYLEKLSLSYMLSVGRISMQKQNDLYKYDCNMCHEKFRTKQNYVIHMRRKHLVLKAWRSYK